MKSSELRGASIPWEAKFEVGSVKGTLNPALFRDDYFGGKNNAEALCGGLVTGWDLQREDGTPMPFDAALVAQEPTWLVVGIWNAVLEKQFPNPTSSATTAST